MALSYDIDVRRSLVLLSAEGAPPREEWFEVLTTAFADPRYRPGFDLLYDRTRIDDTPSPAFVRSWIPRHAELMRRHGDGWLAVVVKSEVVYGMLLIASSFAECLGAAVQPFWSEEEALVWLSSKAVTGEHDALS